MYELLDSTGWREKKVGVAGKEKNHQDGLVNKIYKVEL